MILLIQYKNEGDNIMALKKEILIYIPWFYPKSSFEYNDLSDIFNEMKRYFNITIITIDGEGKLLGNRKQRYYEEKKDKINFIRIAISKKKIIYDARNIRNFIVYFINAMKITKSLIKVDYVFAISTPPILGGILGVMGKFIRKTKMIYNVEEFIPEERIVSETVGNKLLLRLQMFIDTYSCKFSDKVILRSKDMRVILQNRFKDTSNIPSNVFINKYIDIDNIYPLDKYDEKVHQFKKKYDLENKLVVMYLGDMELYNDLNSIIETISRFRDRKDVIFVFAGNGVGRKIAEESALRYRLDNVKFISILKEEFLYAANAADIILVSYMKGMRGILFPEEIYIPMAANKPVIALLEDHSEARNIIENIKCGIVVDSGDYASLYKEIRAVLDEPNLIDGMGSRGREFIENIDRDSIIEKYKKAILET